MRRMRSRAALLVVAIATLASATIGLRHRATESPPTLGGAPRLPAAFVVRCEFTHRAPDDPIVAPGTVAGSHLHDFFGNFTVDTTSTTETLLAGDADCNRRTDRSGYWVPTMLHAGRALIPIGSRVYYLGGSKLADTVQPPPNGLKIVTGGAGNPSAVRWGCSGDDVRSEQVRACGDGFVELNLRFPDCWDGANLDAPDHRSHLAFTVRGRCPSGYPEPITAVRFVVTYPVHSPDELSLSSGGLETAHGDLFVAWHPATIAQLVERCINRRAC